MDQTIDVLVFFAIHDLEAKFGFVFRAFREANGELAAEIVFDEGSFVAGFAGVPRVDAEGGEIADLPFGAAGGSDEILRLIAGRIRGAVKFEPSDGTNVGRRSAVADGIGKIEFDESGDDPAGDGSGLIAGPRSGGFRAASVVFAGRAGSDAANKVPVFLFCPRRVI